MRGPVPKVITLLALLFLSVPVAVSAMPGDFLYYLGASYDFQGLTRIVSRDGLIYLGTGSDIRVYAPDGNEVRRMPTARPASTWPLSSA